MPTRCAPNVAAIEVAYSAATFCGLRPERLTTMSLITTRAPRRHAATDLFAAHACPESGSGAAPENALYQRRWRLALLSSLPGLTRQSIFFARNLSARKMDARVKPHRR